MPGEALVGIVQPSLAIVRGNPANSSRSLRMNLSRKSRSSTRRLIKLSPRDAITRLPLIRAHEGGEDVRLYAVYHTDFFSFLSFFPRPILYIYIIIASVLRHGKKVLYIQFVPKSGSALVGGGA